MRRQLSILIILLVGIISCKNDKSEAYRKVTFYDYQIWTTDLDRIDLRDSLVGYTTKMKRNESGYVRLKFIYENQTTNMYNFDPRNIMYASFDYEIKNDKIFIEGLSCNLIDTIHISYQGQSVDLFVSEYDRDSSCDEESLIYWNNQIGLISQYNYPLGALLLFEYDDFKDFTKVYFYNFIINEEKEKKLMSVSR